MCFIKLDVLSHLSSQYLNLDCQLWNILPAFIRGISRLSLSHRDECCKYLFQSDHLFTACVGMCYARRGFLNYLKYPLQDLVQSLISLDPRHPLWAEREDYLHRYVGAKAKSPLAPESMHDGIRDVFRLINERFEAQQVLALTSSSTQHD